MKSFDVFSINFSLINNNPGSINSITNILIIAPLAIKEQSELIISSLDIIPTPIVELKNENPLVPLAIKEQSELIISSLDIIPTPIVELKNENPLVTIERPHFCIAILIASYLSYPFASSSLNLEVRSIA